MNATEVSSELLRQYSQAGSEPVKVEVERLESADTEVVAEDLLADGELVRHDPDKLRRAVVSLLGEGG